MRKIFDTDYVYIIPMVLLFVLISILIFNNIAKGQSYLHEQIVKATDAAAAQQYMEAVEKKKEWDRLMDKLRKIVDEPTGTAQTGGSK